MTSLDILFWLLVALMGGVAWAIEAGLGVRHRTVLASSVLAAFGSGVMIMFVVDDNSVLVPIEKQKYVRTQGPAAEQGLEQAETKRKQDDKGGSSTSAPAGKQAAAAAPATKGGDDDDDGKIEYSRVPFKDCPVCPDMIIVPSGVSQIGSPSNEPGRGPDEQTAGEVPVPTPFAIGRLEVTRREFAAFVQEAAYQSQTQCDAGRRRGKFDWLKPGIEQDDRHPAVCLSWADVRSYLAWIGGKSGRSYRLPTEVEWEHAARAGTVTPFWTGQSLGRGDANIARSRDGTTVAGMFAANPYGLSDIAGNAWEMTSQCTHENARPGVESANPDACTRLLKGGGWNSTASTGRHAARSALPDGAAANFVGFRVVRAVDERDKARLLSVAQRKQLAQDAKQDAEMKAKQIEAAEKTRYDAREAAAKARLAPAGKAPAKK